MKVSHALTAMAAHAAMDGTARAGPVATPPGRGDFDRETTPVDQSSNNPKVIGSGGQVPSSVSLPEVETPRGYDFGTATYSLALPVPTVTVQLAPIIPFRDPFAQSALTDNVTATTIATDQPSPLGPIAAPFGLPNPAKPTGESVPVVADGPVQLPDGRVGPQITPTQVNTNTAKGTDGPFPLRDGRVGPQIVPGEEDGKDRRQLAGTDRDVIPMPSGVPEESPDH